MTKIPDLGAFFAAQQGPPPTAAQRAHAEQVHKAVRDAQLLAYAQVQFFAPILCNCDRRYDRNAPAPPQLGCVVHGVMQSDDDGAILMFAPPKHW